MLKYDSSSREVRLTVDRDYQQGTCLPYILVTVCLQCYMLLSSSFGRYVQSLCTCYTVSHVAVCLRYHMLLSSMHPYNVL